LGYAPELSEPELERPHRLMVSLQSASQRSDRGDPPRSADSPKGETQLRPDRVENRAGERSLDARVLRSGLCRASPASSRTESDAELLRRAVRASPISSLSCSAVRTAACTAACSRPTRTRML